MANKELFTRSATEMIVLTVLAEQDMYAYQIGQEIKQRSHGLFSLSDGVLYSILYKLAKAGYVTEWTEESNRRIRVYYHLEPEGLARLSHLREEYQNLRDGIDAMLACEALPCEDGES